MSDGTHTAIFSKKATVQIAEINLSRISVMSSDFCHISPQISFFEYGDGLVRLLLDFSPINFGNNPIIQRSFFIYFFYLNDHSQSQEPEKR